MADRPRGIEVHPTSGATRKTTAGARTSAGHARPWARAGVVLEWVRMRLGRCLLVLSVAACSRTLPHPAYVPQPSSALVEVTAPPPPGRIEGVPASPWSSAVWIDGEWIWRRNRWAWKPGAWVEPPKGGRYAPWTFVRGADGRLWVAQGAWRDAKGGTLDAPVPLVSADVEPTQIVNAGGVVEVVGRTLRPGASTGGQASGSSSASAPADAGVAPAARAAPDAGEAPGSGESTTPSTPVPDAGER